MEKLGRFLLRGLRIGASTIAIIVLLRKDWSSGISAGVAWLELPRLQGAIERLASSTWQLQGTPRPSPLAFPLLVERLNNRMSNESVLERVQRLMAEASRAEEESQGATN